MISRSQLTVPVSLLSLLIATSAAIAQPRPGDHPPHAAHERNVIVVSGDAQVQADPDYAIVRLGATAQAQEASTAQEQVNQVMQRSIDAVKDLGIDEKRIRTADLSLYPVYSDRQPRPNQQQQEQEPRIVGYRASNVIAVELSDLDKIGDVIDAVIQAGANQLQGVDFQLRNDTEAKAEALRQAVQSAQRKARVLAEATGVSIEGVAEVIEGGTNIRPPEPMHARAYGMEASSTPVQPGQLTVNANVTIVYRLADQVPHHQGGPLTRPGG